MEQRMRLTLALTFISCCASGNAKKLLAHPPAPGPGGAPAIEATVSRLTQVFNDSATSGALACTLPAVPSAPGWMRLGSCAATTLEKQFF